MRIAARGKYWLQAIDIENGKKILLFYDGFNTLKEAQDMLLKFESVTPHKKYVYEVISK